MSNNNLLQLLSLSFEAIGALLAAIASTPQLHLSVKTATNLDLVGNTLQATGGTFAVNQSELMSQDNFSAQLGTIGNCLVISSILLPLAENDENKIGSAGGFLQAIASGLALFEEQSPTEPEQKLINFSSYFLQMIGDAMQGYAQTVDDKKQRQHYQFIGSWLQTTGALIIALYFSRKYFSTIEL